MTSGRHTSDCLIDDNVFRHLRHSMIVGQGANGNVYGYNFSTDRAYDPVHGTPQPDISVHGNYVFHNVFEVNVLPNDSIGIDSGIEGTLCHGNIEQDTLQWDPACPTTLPDSLYHPVRPEYFPENEINISFPAFGPDVAPVYQIPAEKTFFRGQVNRP